MPDAAGLSEGTSIATAGLVRIARIPRDLSALRRWGRRVGLHARDALDLAEGFRDLRRRGEPATRSVSRYFGLDSSGHSFHVEPHYWLRPGEAQVTRGLASFLSAGGSDRIRAFLRALDPVMAWPADLSAAYVKAEVPTKRGRIDLLVVAPVDDLVWGAVVEAKFGHDIKTNPLPDYRRHAMHLGVSLPRDGGVISTGALMVVGSRITRHTRRRLKMNGHWRFLNWTTLLRRFEIELRGLPDDMEFRRFRRTIWERAK